MTTSRYDLALEFAVFGALGGTFLFRTLVALRRGRFRSGGGFIARADRPAAFLTAAIAMGAVGLGAFYVAARALQELI